MAPQTNKTSVAQLSEAAAASSDPSILAAVVLASCWLDSKLEADLLLNLQLGESIRGHLVRTRVSGWNPDWLFEVGYLAADAAGVLLNSADDPASVSGVMSWTPTVPLHRADDQITDDKPAGSPDRNKRLGGEVLLTCLWRQAAGKAGIDETMVARGLTGNARGSNFRKAIKAYLGARLENWDFPHEKSLDTIYGLHLRQDVGQRSSDILALDDSSPRRRLLAVISSKWTWRSDRGTEAAQMVPLRKYRPDLPYVIVTAEFPRARIVGRESVEDRAYHLSPNWVAAWLTMQLDWGKVDYSKLSLKEAHERGLPLVGALGLETLLDLATDLKRAGTHG